MTNLSTDQVIADMRGWTDLKDFFDGARDQIETDLNTAETRVGDTRRTFFVDQANGDNNNSGATSDDPLQSFEAAIERSVWGGVLSIQLLSDYTVSTAVNFKTGSVIFSGNGNTVREINFADRIDDTNTKSPSISSGYNTTDFVFSRIRLKSRVMAAHVITRHMIGCSGFRAVTFFQSEIDATAGDNLCVFQGNSGHGFGVCVTSTVLSADLPGLWVQSVPAGTLIADINRMAYANFESV